MEQQIWAVQEAKQAVELINRASYVIETIDAASREETDSLMRMIDELDEISNTLTRRYTA
jgi:hypothetical protein